MKSFFKKLLILSLLFTPIVVFARNVEEGLPIGAAIGIEAFISIHMSIFVLKPLSEIIAKENSKKIFWILFAIRVVILLFFDFFITPFIVLIDVFAVFIGAFLLLPVSIAKTNTKRNAISNQVITTAKEAVKGIELKCAKCNSVLQISSKYCPVCGTPFDENNVVVSENENSMVNISKKDALLPSNFDKMYSLSEDQMFEEFINKELIKLGVDKSLKLIPSAVLKRKKFLNIIFSFLVFIFVTLIFFHFPIYTYIIGVVILFIFYKFMKNYNFIKHLKKEIKARPGEKISNILMNVKNTFVKDNTKTLFLVYLLISVILSLIIFINPKILYEKVDDGYAVRYYIFGLTNFKTATIPETYKNEKIVSLRGNTFSNMPFLKSVKLPDSITEIRGQAFKNCKRLIEVNIPKNLQYLGGGAFYNAKSIRKIELPDTLTYLGGEAFYGAESLEYVKLSENLTEIRGDSFKYCTSLKNITIPDNVIRIGGHAFYGDSSLSEVSISKNSKLTEIGSSAFRKCSSLYSITIPEKTYVNERAFKESPTSTYTHKDNTSFNDISNKYEGIINDIALNYGDSFETDYITFEREDTYVISINNEQINLEYFAGFLNYVSSVYIYITNDKYLSGTFDTIVEYYTENYNKIGICNGEIYLLGEEYSDIISCHINENEIKGNFDDIRYYKIYIKNFNIKY